MKRFYLSLLTLVLSVLTSTAQAEVRPGLTVQKRLRGSDDRGTFDLQYIALTPKFSDRVIRAKLNSAMLTVAKDYICRKNSEHKDDMTSTVTTTVTVANRAVLSLHMQYAFYCGGPSAEAGSQPYLYDLRTGAQVNIVDEIRDAAAFQRWIVAEALGHLPLSQKPAECAELYTEGRLANQEFRLELVSNGIIATPDYPHSFRACEFDTALAASALLPLVKPGSVLERAFH